MQKWHSQTNTIASYPMKKFVIEYQGFLLHFCMHTNEFNCVFGSKQLRQYAIRSLIWGYDLIGSRTCKECVSSQSFFLNIEVADPSCERGEILEENSNIFFQSQKCKYQITNLGERDMYDLTLYSIGYFKIMTSFSILNNIEKKSRKN